MPEWIIFVGLALYFAIAMPLALRDQDRYLDVQHIDGTGAHDASR